MVVTPWSSASPPAQSVAPVLQPRAVRATVVSRLPNPGTAVGTVIGEQDATMSRRSALRPPAATLSWPAALSDHCGEAATARRSSSGSSGSKAAKSSRSTKRIGGFNEPGLKLPPILPTRAIDAQQGRYTAGRPSNMSRQSW